MQNYLRGNNAVICLIVISSDFGRTFLAKKVAYYNSWLYICSMKQILNKHYK